MCFDEVSVWSHCYQPPALWCSSGIWGAQMLLALGFWPTQICARPVALPRHHFPGLGTLLLTDHLGLLVDLLSSMTALLSSGVCFATRLWGTACISHHPSAGCRHQCCGPCGASILRVFASIVESGVLRLVHQSTTFSATGSPNATRQRLAWASRVLWVLMAGIIAGCARCDSGSWVCMSFRLLAVAHVFYPGGNGISRYITFTNR